MKKILSVALFMFFLGHVSLVMAQTSPTVTIRAEDQDRYVSFIMEGRAIRNTRIPAMVLDTERGIVWTCQNLQDGKPLWVKADLGQNGDKVIVKRKYIGKMLVWQDADLRMPAMVIDTELGIVWTCQNVIDGKATRIQVDLNSGKEKEIAREEIGVVKAE